MDRPATIGLNLAKNVFQVHGVDSEGTVICRRQLRRSHDVLCPAEALPCGRGNLRRGSLPGAALRALAMKSVSCRPPM